MTSLNYFLALSFVLIESYGNNLCTCKLFKDIMREEKLNLAKREVIYSVVIDLFLTV